MLRGAGVVPQGAADLHGQLVVQRIDQVADVVQHVAHVQPFAAAKARVENLLQVFAAADDHVVVRQRAMAEVVDRPAFLVGLDDPAVSSGSCSLSRKSEAMGVWSVISGRWSAGESISGAWRTGKVEPREMKTREDRRLPPISGGNNTRSGRTRLSKLSNA